MKIQYFKLLEKSSTLFLRIILFFLGLGTIILSGLLLYQITKQGAMGGYRPILIGVVISTLPFHYIYFQAFQLLNLIDKNLSLSETSVRCLRNIKLSSFIISVMYLIGSPFIFGVAEKDDAPGVVLINLILIVGPFSVGVFAFILQKLLINAIGYKSENDLTI